MAVSGPCKLTRDRFKCTAPGLRFGQRNRSSPSDLLRYCQHARKGRAACRRCLYLVQLHIFDIDEAPPCCDSKSAWLRAPTEPRTDPFALINLGKTMLAQRNNTILGYLKGTFEKTSSHEKRTVYTYETEFLGDRVIFTCDPKNIQAILATQFKDFELGQVRIGSFYSLWVGRISV